MSSGRWSCRESCLGTVVGLLSGSARLYLLDGLVPLVAFGAACLASLLSARPLMYRIALETMGEGTPKQKTFAAMWEHPGFRKSFQVITIVWGIVFLAEAGVQALIIETQSINAAKQTSNLLPIAVLAVTLGWTRRYGQRSEQRLRNTAAQADNTDLSSGHNRVDAATDRPHPLAEPGQ